MTATTTRTLAGVDAEIRRVLELLGNLGDERREAVKREMRLASVSIEEMFEHEEDTTEMESEFDRLGGELDRCDMIDSYLADLADEINK